MRVASRLRRAIWGVRHETTWAWHHVREGKWSYLANVLSYRLMGASQRLRPRHPARLYRLVTDTGLTLWYRRDRGDIQSIREILVDEIYRLPEGVRPTSLVDFGAHIGVATVWLCREYQISDVAAVEPHPDNFALLERNCRDNDLKGHLVQAAVGAASGEVLFSAPSHSNLGRTGTGDDVVESVGVDTLMRGLAFAPDLVKIDIEGGEGELFTDDVIAWVDRVQAIVMEMHPEFLDIEPIITSIEGRGFTYFPPVEVTRGHERAKRERLFVRDTSVMTQ